MTQSQQATNAGQELVHYWSIGDMHYRAVPAWHEFHTRRLAAMFDDLHALWQDGERPAFCVSPGDLIETSAQENYELAKKVLDVQLAGVPLYPGIGNHEYYGPKGEDPARTLELFNATWGWPVRYAWESGGVGFIMLDYPGPHTLKDPGKVYLSDATLNFLDATLDEYKGRPAVIFVHCPLRDTVLDRDAEKRRDYSSSESFFSPENSQEVRDILAHRGNACLFISGHTHTGWEAPNIVFTEQLGGHPLTSVNLMSPWYTGARIGPRLSEDQASFTYRADDPDIVPSFSFRIYPDHAIIRLREHRSRQWLKEWRVPLVV